MNVVCRIVDHDVSPPQPSQILTFGLIVSRNSVPYTGGHNPKTTNPGPEVMHDPMGNVRRGLQWTRREGDMPEVAALLVKPRNELRAGRHVAGPFRLSEQIHRGKILSVADSKHFVRRVVRQLLIRQQTIRVLHPPFLPEP